MKRMRAFVSGTVQGVFFRAHTKQWALHLGLTGWAKNLTDGRVEVIAEGPQTKLKELLEKIKQGPPGSTVDNVDVDWREAKKKFSTFFIKRD
jgi:acylphosphatase